MTPTTTADAEMAAAFTRLNAQVIARIAAERARLLGQPVQAPDGRLGIVDSVHTNVHGDVLGHVLGYKSYPATYYAETLKVVGKE